MKAGASFKPHAVDDDGHLQEMIIFSWKKYEEIEGIPEAGVRRHRHFEASRKPIDETQKPYLSVMENLVRHDHSGLVPGGYPYALKYTTFLIDPNKFIPFLVKTVKDNGGKLIEGKVFKHRTLSSILFFRQLFSVSLNDFHIYF